MIVTASLLATINVVVLIAAGVVSVLLAARKVLRERRAEHAFSPDVAKETIDQLQDLADSLQKRVGHLEAEASRRDAQIETLLKDNTELRAKYETLSQLELVSPDAIQSLAESLKEAVETLHRDARVGIVEDITKLLDERGVIPA